VLLAEQVQIAAGFTKLKAKKALLPIFSLVWNSSPLFALSSALFGFVQIFIL